MRAKKRKYYSILSFLILWFILLFSRIGHIIAGATIMVSIIVIFLCGCIPIKTKSGKP